MTDRLAPTHYRKTLTGFEPVSEAAREWWAKTKLGQIVELKGRRPRNPGHHRKLFALLKLLADNTENFINTEHALMAVKATTGHGAWTKPHPAASREMFFPESIAFDAMDQDAFNTFYEAAVTAVLKFWLPVERSELSQAIEEFAA